MRVRLLRIQNVDLNLFEFDWDMTWSCFFMHPDGKVYGRYGGRDGTGADSRNTLLGLRFAMEAAVQTHKERSGEPAPEVKSPLIITRLAAAKKFRGGECLHCHQMKEILREHEMEQGTWSRDKLWTYPLPENIGITLDKDQGNQVKSITQKSPVSQLDVQPGDQVEAINGLRVRSFADAQYALHKAPLKGDVAIQWKRGDKQLEGKITVEEGWKKTNVTWRPSVLDLLPALAVYGSDLDVSERKKLGLSEQQLAFRQKDPAHSRAVAMGIRPGDIILGLNDQKLEMTVDGFLGYVRRNYLVGDRITLNLIRDGKRLDLPVKLSN